jgi:hypothetical protein
MPTPTNQPPVAPPGIVIKATSPTPTPNINNLPTQAQEAVAQGIAGTMGTNGQAIAQSFKTSGAITAKPSGEMAQKEFAKVIDPNSSYADVKDALTQIYKFRLLATTDKRDHEVDKALRRGVERAVRGLENSDAWSFTRDVGEPNAVGISKVLHDIFEKEQKAHPGVNIEQELAGTGVIAARSRPANAPPVVPRQDDQKAVFTPVDHYIESSDVQVRRNAVEYLNFVQRHNGNPVETAKRFALLINDPDKSVSEAATQGLKNMGEAGKIALKNMDASKLDPNVSKKALDAAFPTK